jgi:uncharacterized protein
MDQQLSLITLAVADLDRSRRFYIDGLGWSPILDLEEIVFFQIAHGVALALFPERSLRSDIGPTEVDATPGRSSTPAGFTLAHNVGDTRAVDVAVERARAAGATVLKEPQRADFGGYHAYVADPDGIRWEVCHNPGWTVTGDGTVRLEVVED